MNKELEEAIKTCNKIIKENERIIKILQKTLKSKTEEYLQIQINAIETVLKHIKNSIPKERIEKIVEELRKEYELLLEHQSGQESNRTKYLRGKIHMCQEFLEEK